MYGVNSVLYLTHVLRVTRIVNECKTVFYRKTLILKP